VIFFQIWLIFFVNLVIFAEKPVAALVTSCLGQSVSCDVSTHRGLQTKMAREDVVSIMKKLFTNKLLVW